MGPVGFLAVAVLLPALPGAAPGQALPTRPELPDTLAGEVYLEVATPGVEIRFAPSDSLLAARVLTVLEEEPPLPGLPPGVPAGVRVVLAHSAAAFDEITGGRVPEWRAGVALPALNLLVVPAREGKGLLSREGRVTLRHEWAHLGLHQFLGDLRVPRWFDEGYAQWASVGFDASEAWRLRVLLALGRAPPLDSLTLSWPRRRASAEAAYLLAASSVTYLLEGSGTKGLELFLRRWREMRSFEAAFRDTFGVTSSQFEEDWRRHVKRRYGWLLALSHSAVFWMIMALVLLVMVRIRVRYNRDRMARLRAGELPEEPAFWRDGEEEDGPNPGDAGIRGP